MNKIVKGVIALSIFTIFVSCTKSNKPEDGQPPVKAVKDLVVPQDFVRVDFTTATCTVNANETTAAIKACAP